VSTTRKHAILKQQKNTTGSPSKSDSHVNATKSMIQYAETSSLSSHLTAKSTPMAISTTAATTKHSTPHSRLSITEKYQTRRYDKGEYVNVNTNKGFLHKGKIIKWEYDRVNKTYDYLVEDITGTKQSWWEEGHLENLKIYLPRENKEKMEVFYEALNTTGLNVSFQNNEKKKTYILVGKDLDIAKAFFRGMVKGQWTNQIVVYDKLYTFYPDGKFRTVQKLAKKGQFLCQDCGHVHGNER